MIGISHLALLARIRRGHVAATKVGRIYLISVDEVTRIRGK